MEPIIIIVISVGVLFGLLCCGYFGLYCFAEWKYKNATPFVFENPSFKNISESRQPGLTYYKHNINANDMV